jgi:hypothetical protein
MELKDFKITKAKLGVILMCVIVIIAASQLSPLFLSAGETTKETTADSFKPVKELSFDEFTIKDPMLEGGKFNGAGGNMSSIPASYNMGTPGLNETADSLIFENDSVFTIEGIKDEMSNDGDWIKVTAAEVDPEGVTDNSGGFDNEINTDYVWRPRNVGAGWSPYTNGYWRYTNCGWMWSSYYSWGWRPYHYGRWWWSDYYGWVWSPGYIFAPAWVVWLYNDDYCGWYPISPRIRCNNYYGWRCHNMRYRVRHWNFCHKKDFANPLRPPVLIVDPSYNGGIIKTSTYAGVLNPTNDGVRNDGPKVNDIEKYNGQKIVKEDITKYGTKNITPVNNDVNNEKKYNDTRQPKDDGTVKNSDGTKQKENDNEKVGGKEKEINTGKNDDGIKKYDEKKHEEKLKDYEKQKQNEQKQNEQKQNEQKQNEQKQKEKQREPEKKKEYDKPKEKTKESYTPPPQENYTPPKESYDPPKKDNYSPPKNENPPKRESTPPKKETYNPPKNDDGK